MQKEDPLVQPIAGFTTALWWVPEGDEPRVAEALSRLDHLRAHGPAPGASSLRQQFDGRSTRRKTTPRASTESAEDVIRRW